MTFPIDTELTNPLDPDRLTLQLFNPYDRHSAELNDATIKRAIETVRTDEQNVLLVYPHETMNTRWIHDRTRKLAQTHKSLTGFQISTMTLELFKTLTIPEKP